MSLHRDEDPQANFTEIQFHMTIDPVKATMEKYRRKFKHPSRSASNGASRHMKPLWVKHDVNKLLSDTDGFPRLSQ
jgi:hypothetical protein